MKISNKLILDGSITNWEFIVCTLLLDQAGDNDQIVINKSALCATYCMGPIKRSIKENLYKALDLLIEKKLIVPIFTFKSDMALYDISLLLDYSNIQTSYTLISYNELRRILSYNKTQHRSILLRYFSYMVMHFNYSKKLPKDIQGKYGYRTMKMINNDFNGVADNRNWIVQVNKILQDLQLLYVQSSNGYIQSGNNKQYRPPNIYCRYEDAAGALDYAVKYVGWNISIKMNIDADDVEEYIPPDENNDELVEKT